MEGVVITREEFDQLSDGLILSLESDGLEAELSLKVWAAFELLNRKLFGDRIIG